MATMLSPALGAAMRLSKIGSSSGAEETRSDFQSNTALPAEGSRNRTTLGTKQARLRQLFDMYALANNGQLGMDSLVVLIETIHSAERALTAESVDEIRGGRSIAAVGSGAPSRASAEREARLIGQFIFNHRKQSMGTDATRQSSSLDPHRTGQPTSIANIEFC